METILDLARPGKRDFARVPHMTRRDPTLPAWGMNNHGPEMLRPPHSRVTRELRGIHAGRV